MIASYFVRKARGFVPSPSKQPQVGPSLRPGRCAIFEAHGGKPWERWPKRLVCTLILCGMSAQWADAGFVPIPLTAASYNQDMIVERTAPAPVIAGGYTTASMDNGVANTANSWYEQGYNTASPATGLPHAGSTFTHQNLPNHSYRMAPSYAANNAVLLDSSLTSATLTLPSPTACAQLSLLESGGSGGVAFSYSVHHQNGTTESGSGTIPASPRHGKLGVIGYVGSPNRRARGWTSAMTGWISSDPTTATGMMGAPVRSATWTNPPRPRRRIR